MYIKAYLAELDNNFEIKDILDESDYIEGTNLDIRNLTVYTYYEINNTVYSLIFELDEESLKSGIKLEYLKEKTNKKLELKEYNGKRYFVDITDETEKNKKDYATAGYKTINVIDSNGIIIEAIDIKVLSSSLKYHDYLDMINDLIKIKKNIIYDEDKKVYVGINKNTFEDQEEYIREVEKIYKLAKRIFDNPKMGLKKKFASENINNIKKFSPKTIMKKELYPFKTTYTVEKIEDDINIYENRIIKYSLERILYKLSNLNNDNERYINHEENKIKTLKSKFSNKEIERYLKIISKEKEKNRNLKELEFNIVINTDDKGEKEENVGNIEYNKFKGKFVLKRESFKLFEKDKIFFENNINEGTRIVEHNGESIVNNIYKTRYFSFIYETDEIKKIKYVYDALMNNKGVLKFKIYGDIEASRNKNNHDIVKIIFKDIKSISRVNKFNKFEKIMPENDIDDLIFMISKMDVSLINMDYIHSVFRKEDTFFKEREKIENIKILELQDKIKKLLSKDEIKRIKRKRDFLRESQIFNSNPNYNKIFRALKKLDRNTNFLSEPTAEKYFLKTSPYIYEFWCYYKMIDILVNDIRWEIVAGDDIKEAISRVLENKGVNESLRVITLKHKIKKETIYLSVSYEKRTKDRKNPDYTFEFYHYVDDKKESLGIVYLDAKYRDYKKQVEGLFYKDIENVAIDKYYLNNREETLASFIIHNHNDDKYVTYGGCDIWKETPVEYKEYSKDINIQGYSEVNHRFGSFYMVPSNVDNFRKFMLMILEYKLGYYDVCWCCGEYKNVLVEEAFTRSNYKKTYYKCKNCGEFWTKSHCSNNINSTKGKNHTIVKHLDNYHYDKNDGKWFVVCPVCFDC